jgi:hypothetical protein
MYSCDRCGTRFQTNGLLSENVWSKLDRIAGKLMGVFWYCDYHGLGDSDGQSCECSESTHETRNEKIEQLLARVEKTLDTKPNWRLYYEDASVFALRELIPPISEIQSTKPIVCAVFVEGDDDWGVISEFLTKQAGTDLRNSGVHIVKPLGGGKERAVQSAKYIATTVMRTMNLRIPYLIVLDGDAADWLRTQKEVEADKVFVLSKKEIDSYLLDERALAHAFNVTEDVVAQQLRATKGAGKEKLEHIIQTFGFRSTPVTKQIIARHMVSVPDDFVKMFAIITGGSRSKSVR